MKCAVCGLAARADSNFCVRCGARLDGRIQARRSAAAKISAVVSAAAGVLIAGIILITLQNQGIAARMEKTPRPEQSQRVVDANTAVPAGTPLAVFENGAPSASPTEIVDVVFPTLWMTASPTPKPTPAPTKKPVDLGPKKKALIGRINSLISQIKSENVIIQKRLNRFLADGMSRSSPYKEVEAILNRNKTGIDKLERLRRDVEDATSMKELNSLESQLLGYEVQYPERLPASYLSIRPGSETRCAALTPA